jgi:hypothetical protein
MPSYINSLCRACDALGRGWSRGGGDGGEGVPHCVKLGGGGGATNGPNRSQVTTFLVGAIIHRLPVQGLGVFWRRGGGWGGGACLCGRGQ